MTERLESVFADRLRPGPNDRKDFDPDALDKLAASIATHGLAQRPVVRPLDGDDFEIVCGERRVRAMTEVLRWTIIPVVVRDMTDREAAAVMLAENMARAALDPMEEASAYRSRMERFGLTVEEVAADAGVAPFRVRWRLELLLLGREAAEHVRGGTLPLGHARRLAAFDLDADRQHAALAALAAHDLGEHAFAEVCAGLRDAQDAEAQSEFGFVVESFVARAKARKLGKAGLLDLVARLAAVCPDEELAAEAAEALAGAGPGAGSGVASRRPRPVPQVAMIA